MAETYTEVEPLVEAFRAFGARLCRGVIRVFVERAQAATPVDTGWLRANWLTSIGVPTGRLNGRRGYAAGDFDPSLPEVLLEQLDGWRPEHGSIFVENNVPYGPKVNASHPGARGFVLAAVVAAVTLGPRMVAF